MNGIRYSSKEQVVKDTKMVGKCEPDKCNSACCRFVVFWGNDCEETRKFWEGFEFVYVDVDGNMRKVLYKDCNHLKDNRCELHGMDEQPMACVHFPTPKDDHYRLVRDVCTCGFPPEQLKMGDC